MTTTSYNFFTVLGNKRRIDILNQLAKCGPMTVGELTRQLNLEQSAVSHCLQTLLNYHFVNVQNSGRSRVYTINSSAVEPILELMQDHEDVHCKKCGH